MRRKAWSSAGLTWAHRGLRPRVGTNDSGFVRPGVRGLNGDRPAMDRCGTGMNFGLVPVRRGRLGIRRPLCIPLRCPLVLQRSSLALTRPLLAPSSLACLILIGHTCMVPNVDTRNQLV